MHNRFFGEWRKRAIVRISVVLRTEKDRQNRHSGLIGWKGTGRGLSGIRYPPTQLVTVPHNKKDIIQQ